MEIEIIMIHFSSVEIDINFLLVFFLTWELVVYYLGEGGILLGDHHKNHHWYWKGHFWIRDHYRYWKSHFRIRDDYLGGGGGGGVNKSYESSTK